MAKEKERFNQDEEKAPTASEVLASAAAALNTSAAALTSSASALTSAATALTSAADALTSYASTSDDAAAYPSSSGEEDADDDQADLQGENDPTGEGILKLFREFKARRDGIVRALTTDVEIFHTHCDPDKDELCLYGHVDGTWVVTDPVKEVPPDMPEPTVGINFVRNHLNRKEWLARVAMHSDAWLYRTTFYKRHNLEDKSRIELFSMINNLPTIHEAVMEAAKKPSNKSPPKKKRNKSASELMPPPKRTPEAGKMIQ